MWAWLQKKSAKTQTRALAVALYDRVVALARDPHWFTNAAIPDTLDGRFDSLALWLSLLMHRLERESDGAAALRQELTGLFIADMDQSLREMGVGDLSVGKRVKESVSAFAGRYEAYKLIDSPDGGQAFAGALARNLYRGMVPSPQVLDWTTRTTQDFWQHWQTTALAELAQPKEFVS